MATQTVSAKRCVNCHTDVTKGKRMKDSSGRYWCVKCGMADQKKKMVGTGDPCDDCGEKFSPAKLSKYGSARICAGCARQREKGPGLFAQLKGGGEADKARLMKMLGAMALLAVIAAWRIYSARHH